MRVTEAAHAFVAPALGLGGIHLDATCGNGHDTLFLLRHAPVKHLILALDLQPTAVAETERRVHNAGYPNERCRVICDDHANLCHHLPPTPSIGIAIFNLGYLPGGDHSIITQPSTTIAALETIRRLLVNNGRLAVAVYPDHPGGSDESEAVDAWFLRQGVPPVSRPPRGPYLQTYQMV